MKRADELIFTRGFAESRSKARALIEDGCVMINSTRVDKPSRKFPEDAKIEISVSAAATRYVSRAGLKLEGLLRKFNVDLSGIDILDAGASTGGFTDCALKFGANCSVCVDVGSGQLHPKLLADERVVNMEKTDIRTLTPESFNGKKFGFICGDLSFISIEKIFSYLWELLADNGKIAILVKPQFESSPKLMRLRGGVLKPEESAEAFDKISNYISTEFPDAKIVGSMESPIRGGDGNIEYMLLIKKS